MPLTGQLEGIITENSGRVTILKGEMCLWGKGGKFGKRGEEKLRKKDQLFSILTKMKIDHIIKVSIDTFGGG